MTVSFTWNNGLKEVQLTDLRYYTDHNTVRANEVTDQQLLERLKAEKIEPQLYVAALQEITKRLPSEVKESKLARSVGSATYALSDDACVSAGFFMTKLTDPDETELMKAADVHDTTRVRTLLRNGRDNINAVDQHGSTALLLASATLDSKDLLALLLQAGANVNASDKQGYTALMNVCFGGEFEEVKLLLSYKVDVTAKDVRGDTALMRAAGAEEEGVKIIPVLVAAGAKVNDQNNLGVTPLMFAARDGSPETVRLLLQLGADASVRDKNGKTAMDYALLDYALKGSKEKQQQTVTLLQEALTR